jgi:hypothetical protein
VLLAIAVFLIYAAESTARVVREAKVATLKTNAELAYWAAEAGFNRARAALIGGATPEEMEAMDELTPVVLYTSTGEAAGKYTLTVTAQLYAVNTFNVIATGIYGAGKYEARQVIRGTLSLVDPDSEDVPRNIHTAYELPK